MPIAGKRTLADELRKNQPFSQAANDFKQQLQISWLQLPRQAIQVPHKLPGDFNGANKLLGYSFFDTHNGLACCIAQDDAI
ncbi:hypothetical protein [Lysobacter rhizosphaerae]